MAAAKPLAVTPFGIRLSARRAMPECKTTLQEETRPHSAQSARIKQHWSKALATRAVVAGVDTTRVARQQFLQPTSTWRRQENRRAPAAMRLRCLLARRFPLRLEACAAAEIQRADPPSRVRENCGMRIAALTNPALRHSTSSCRCDEQNRFAVTNNRGAEATACHADEELSTS